ncbi:MAG: TlpA disulfide reductase family protein [Alteraurantiacibacter sp.]
MALALAAAVIISYDRIVVIFVDNDGDGDGQGGEEVATETGGAAFSGFVDRTFAGDPLPTVTLTDPAGATLDLHTATRKPVLLNLWATWCVPCVTEMPLLDRIAGEMAGSLTVLTVSEDLEGGTTVPPFFAEKGFEHLPQWLDQTNELAIAFGGGGSLPLTVMYDAEGKELWRVIGAYDWDSEEARALLTEAASAARS